ncbi:MAG: DEAD/DEAH box helicase [Polyangia bacterium]
MSFDSLDLYPSLTRAISDLGFDDPTAIQRDGIPPALAGRDVLGCAMTGSGKTAAFALPILQQLLDERPGVTRALVLAPTRELALQIVEHTNALAAHTRVSAAAVFGGVAMAPQVRALRGGTDVIVACPGRLLDHMQYDYARLAGLEILVLDEADRMLDMGFLPDIKRVLGQLPPLRQKLLFSATMPRPIVELSKKLLRDPAVLDVARPAAPASGVQQTAFPVRGDLKPALLLELLERGEIDNALVFTRTKHRANRLARFLDKRGIASDRIHGNRSQPQRVKALEDLKSRRIRVLVATDVAARGIDIEALSHVVNLDVPHPPEDYIHRVGRTARAGATGEAFTFVSPEERKEIAAIESQLRKRVPIRELEGFDYRTPPSERFEVPIQDRIAAIRARRAEERARSRVRIEARAEREAAKKARRSSRSQSARPPAGESGDSKPRRRGRRRRKPAPASS